MMRIISGRARGIRLATLEGDNTRPTSERAKEAVFSMLRFDLEGREVLDLFAGSGQMGLEAVSGGANGAVFVDKSKEAIAIINKNIEKTKLGEYCRAFNSDAFDYIRAMRGKKKFDIVFVDPPYALRATAECLSALLNAGLLKTSSLVVCESEEENIFENAPELLSKYEIVKKAKYGIAHITIVKPI